MLLPFWATWPVLIPILKVNSVDSLAIKGIFDKYHFEESRGVVV